MVENEIEKYAKKVYLNLYTKNNLSFSKSKAFYLEKDVNQSDFIILLKNKITSLKKFFSNKICSVSIFHYKKNKTKLCKKSTSSSVLQVNTIQSDINIPHENIKNNSLVVGHWETENDGDSAFDTVESHTKNSPYN
ncbi:hypothetical protein [Pectinatus frisingensis]|uniref:hypothetical protein n=1 Tax=Pectinatus frisingensis TaxID=865 RepID=UPI003D804E3C